MNVDDLVSCVIPPSDYQHRNGFTNTSIIDGLTEDEKIVLETALIQKLLSEVLNAPDTLIIDTLAYLRSIKSLPVLRQILEVCNDIVSGLPVAAAIFKINNDIEMVDIAVNLVKQMDKKDAYYTYKLIHAFFYLAKFKSEKTKQIFQEYRSHPDFLVSYNAKEALAQ